MELNTYHFIAAFLLGVIAFLYVSLWALTSIQRWWNRRKRERMQ